MLPPLGERRRLVEAIRIIIALSGRNRRDLICRLLKVLQGIVDFPLVCSGNYGPLHCRYHLCECQLAGALFRCLSEGDIADLLVVPIVEF